MKRDAEGCAICGSTWGEAWGEVEGERMFFCCDVCKTQFQGLVDRIKQEAGWDRLDALSIEGDRRGRTCRARRGGTSVSCWVAFNPRGEIREFRILPPASPAGT